MTSIAANTTNKDNWQWPANLELILSHTERGSRLTRNRHSGPLYVQKPFYPEGKDSAHIYLLHPPGGLVSGDSLEVMITVQEAAHGLITTPGAARMYKARKDYPVQRQNTKIDIADNGVLEWFPMEAIVYTGASAELNTVISLEGDARFIGWEITCFGLPASDQLFVDGSFKQRYCIEKDNLPVYIDQLNINATQTNFFTGAAGLQTKTVNGFMLAGPFPEITERQQMLDTLRELLSEKAIALTMAHDFCVIRYLGNSAFYARQYFTKAWALLRPLLLNKQPCAPRIWLT